MSLKSKTCVSERSGAPLTEYYSEFEALEGAEYARFNYASDLVPYQCPNCNKWHLAPKNRQTPSRQCQYCTDSYGGEKALYVSKEAAKRRANILKKEQGAWLRVYKCPHQTGWHLAKSR